ncbi:SAM-dependent methyltransferase [Amycolatopsis sp., V23-08]|uniref:SAM-dependent methyltransferase n=1 Tax=Amycolatopsis heterodermiae TaxID=3110235 RepID=A0ABU5RIL5_9PSEU|nr:SAM-dependent methyltransferase [Amycolatopsis sp., V23-08]MEA5366112.1 SAM-dependent methyltransferase [Amycolatopsis sp., V23-08]
MIVDTTSYAVQARARLWNLMLGGSEAYENDRWLLDSLTKAVPNVAQLAVNEREFVDRLWRYASGTRGIEQVVHIGAPLPAGLPPHRRLAQPGRVVYVENEELLARKGEAWLTGPDVAVAHADPLDIAELVDAVSKTELRSGTLDWLEPIAVIAPGVLSWVGEPQARTWVKRLLEELPTGSVLATTHLFDPQLAESVVPIEQLLFHLDGQVGAGFFRRQAAIENLIPAGVALDHPGMQLAVDWWPNGPRLRPVSLVDQLLAAVVGTISRST